MPINPFELGWLPAYQVLENLDWATFGGEAGMGSGAGNAPPPRDYYTMDEVIEVVNRAKRSHLGLL